MQANNAAMAVFSPLDTNIMSGFQFSSAATPMSTFPDLGPRAALAAWAKKPSDTAHQPSTAGVAIEELDQACIHACGLCQDRIVYSAASDMIGKATHRSEGCLS